MPDDMYRVLCGMREVTGQSISALVVELLEVSVPSLDRLVEAFRPIKAAETLERARLGAALMQAQHDLEPLVAQAMGTWEAVHAVIGKAAGEAAAAPRLAPLAPVEAAPPPTLRPPSTNRGGTNHDRPEQGAQIADAQGASDAFLNRFSGGTDDAA